MPSTGQCPPCHCAPRSGAGLGDRGIGCSWWSPKTAQVRCRDRDPQQSRGGAGDTLQHSLGGRGAGTRRDPITKPGDTSDLEPSAGADTRTAPSGKTITHHPPVQPKTRSQFRTRVQAEHRHPFSNAPSPRKLKINNKARLQEPARCSSDPRKTQWVRAGWCRGCSAPRAAMAGLVPLLHSPPWTRVQGCSHHHSLQHMH